MWVVSLLRSWKLKPRCWSGGILGWRLWERIGFQVYSGCCRIQFLAAVGLKFLFPCYLSAEGFSQLPEAACIPCHVVPSISELAMENLQHLESLSDSFLSLSLSSLSWISKPRFNLPNLRSTDLGRYYICKNPFTATPRLVFSWITGRTCIYTRGQEL